MNIDDEKILIHIANILKAEKAFAYNDCNEIIKSFAEKCYEAINIQDALKGSEYANYLEQAILMLSSLIELTKKVNNSKFSYEGIFEKTREVLMDVKKSDFIEKNTEYIDKIRLIRLVACLENLTPVFYDIAYLDKLFDLVFSNFEELNKVVAPMNDCTDILELAYIYHNYAKENKLDSEESLLIIQKIFNNKLKFQNIGNIKGVNTYTLLSVEEKTRELKK